MKYGWVTCGHCEGSGTCKNKIKTFTTIFWIIPFPIRTSDATCLIAAGIDPSKHDFIVKCSVCKGTGKVWLGPNGERDLEMQNFSSTQETQGE
jgi:hypothetical protein